MDSLLKQGEELYKSGQITQEDAKDAFQAFSKGDNFQDSAKDAYSAYQENHKGGEKKGDKADSKDEKSESK
ncbi:NADPH-dependent methylglyoxal reductase [Candida orthopsilosis Co 90-125]|uniref:NADPH-dependent methylglyoxal reductase n=1 Tax=Candida orthopsilosis (strain 90-125) TaxID=1136231 RepID=H8WZT3_CANO9|nr:NADPH-dependent methylglyoxal reductase [Candida orthopsilosis Co 90-125]CCG22278.1 NADPH-dependent methylglyoxal reductase [Candida orthopsilosis Co 90-125]